MMLHHLSLQTIIAAIDQAFHQIQTQCIFDRAAVFDEKFFLGQGYQITCILQVTEFAHQCVAEDKNVVK